MAPKFKKSMISYHAGVKKTQKIGIGKQINSHNSTSQSAGRPDTAKMLMFSKIDFSPLIAKAMQAKAMLANSSNPTSLDVLPIELLMQITQELPVEDQIRVALTYPDHFMNDGRLNIFAVDAHHQLDIRTYSLAHLPQHNWLNHVRKLRLPLLFEAILPNSGNFTVYELGVILDQYEQVCINNQINPHTFLNSVFPDRRPANVPLPSNGPYTLAIMSPLCKAVEAGRTDIVDYLIQRGANVTSGFPYWGDNRLLTPFQYGLAFSAASVGNYGGADRQRVRMIEDTVLQLAYTSTITAWLDNFQASEEFSQAVTSGMDRLAVLLLQRWEAQDGVDRTADLYQLVRTIYLQEILKSDQPMTLSIRFMLDHGGNTSILYEHVSSVTLEAINGGGHSDNAVCALQWEIDTEAEELELAIRAIATLAADDENFLTVRPLAAEFIRQNHYRGQSQLLGLSILGENKSPWTRASLIMGVRDDVLDGGMLRLAIRLRDKDSVAFIIETMKASGQSIDEPLPSQPGDTDVSHWFQTPLTYALAQENYYEAANLLSLGANPNRIPPNIRHRVRVLRDRVNAYIRDPAAVVFQGLNVESYKPNLREEAQRALDFVFGRLLDDPSCPLPNHVRTTRYPHLPDDDPLNDSDTDGRMVLPILGPL